MLKSCNNDISLKTTDRDSQRETITENNLATDVWIYMGCVCSHPVCIGPIELYRSNGYEYIRVQICVEKFYVCSIAQLKLFTGGIIVLINVYGSVTLPFSHLILIKD